MRHTDALGLGVGVARRERREGCEARLFAAIASGRAIAVDDVKAARRELDRRGFDWLVNLPMAVITLAAAWLLTRAVRRRFPDELMPRVVSTAVLSIGLATGVIGVGQMWAFLVEAVRIGNAHLGYRGLRIPWGQHRAATFALAMLTMWTIAAMPALGTHLRHHRHPGTNL